MASDGIKIDIDEKNEMWGGLDSCTINFYCALYELFSGVIIFCSSQGLIIWLQSSSPVIQILSKECRMFMSIPPLLLLYFAVRTGIVDGGRKLSEMMIDDQGEVVEKEGRRVSVWGVLLIILVMLVPVVLVSIILSGFNVLQDGLSLAIAPSVVYCLVMLVFFVFGPLGWILTPDTVSTV